MPIVQFQPFSSLVNPSFWHSFTDLKIDVIRLSDEPLPIVAYYTVGRSIKDRETGHDVDLGCNVSLGGDAFSVGEQSHNPFSVSATGVLKNFNTVEAFKAADKTALFNAEAGKIWESIISTRSTALLNRFLVITYADLKKYKYYYWFSFPAFVAKPAWETDGSSWRAAAEVFQHEPMAKIHKQLKSKTLPYFLVNNEGAISPVEEYEQFFAGVPVEYRTIAFLDPNADPTHPGWPLRNLLAYVRAIYPSLASIRVLCWRDIEVPSTHNDWKSRFGVLTTSPTQEVEQMQRPSAVGWEKNTQQKLAPRIADLAPMMDPKRLAEQAVDLNLKLMRWRILPSLDLDKVAATKCLLLGAGTLGCYVSRALMGWGVRHITFVDSASVSFSNPVRQPLFQFEDCLDGGKPKAQCAADALKRIFPGINATGHTISIPMPGHPVPPALVEQTKKDVAILETLFDEHDAIFLLMDSRESRWLPTLLGVAKGKIVMNAALGFDTFLVMRHGARAAVGYERLGCYYCNDIVAPADSLTDRTLDQMCTVTRPGLASIAAASAVELLVSLLQHPLGVHAPAPPPQANNAIPDASTSQSVLGLVPHQLRGYLAQFRNIHIMGAAYNRCTGCSETVLKAYETEGFDMLIKAFNEPKYLESLTGLDKLYAESEAVMESVDWDEGDDDI